MVNAANPLEIYNVLSLMRLHRDILEISLIRKRIGYFCILWLINAGSMAHSTVGNQRRAIFHKETSGVSKLG